MVQKKMGYGILQFLYITTGVAGILTAIPWNSAGKDCFLHYRALCPFTPISTIFCLIIGAMIFFIQKEYFIQRIPKNVN